MQPPLSICRGGALCMVQGSVGVAAGMRNPGWCWWTFLVRDPQVRVTVVLCCAWAVPEPHITPSWTKEQAASSRPDTVNTWATGTGRPGPMLVSGDHQGAARFSYQEPGFESNLWSHHESPQLINHQSSSPALLERGFRKSSKLFSC